MLQILSGDEAAHISKLRMSLGINITIPEQQRPDEGIIDFIDRVKAKVVDLYAHLEAYDSNVTVEVVPVE